MEKRMAARRIFHTRRRLGRRIVHTRRRMERRMIHTRSPRTHTQTDNLRLHRNPPPTQHNKADQSNQQHLSQPLSHHTWPPSEQEEHHREQKPHSRGHWNNRGLVRRHRKCSHQQQQHLHLIKLLVQHQLPILNLQNTTHKSSTHQTAAPTFSNHLIGCTTLNPIFPLLQVPKRLNPYLRETSRENSSVLMPLVANVMPNWAIGIGQACSVDVALGSHLALQSLAAGSMRFGSEFWSGAKA